MSDKIDKIVSQVDRIVFLLEEQNKAWSVQLELMSNALRMVDAKLNAQQNLLKENPPVSQPSESEPSAVRMEFPLNTYGDVKPYGVDIDEQKQAPPRSFNGSPPSVNRRQQTENTEPEPQPSGERVVSLKQPKKVEKQPMPQSKAEILAQQTNLPPKQS